MKKYRILNYFLFGMTFLTSIFLINLLFNPRFIFDILKSPILTLIYGLVVLIASSYYFVFQYTRKYHIIGNIELTEGSINVDLQDSLSNYPVTDIKNIKIERASSWHRDSSLLEIPYGGNNIITIRDKNNSELKMEFLIEDKQANAQFDKLIIQCREWWNEKLIYTTV